MKEPFNNTPQAIIEYLTAHRQEMERFLTSLVEAESPSLVPESQAMVMTLLWEALAEIGFKVEIIPGKETGGHLLAQKDEGGADKPRQLLLGHCDTVWPIGTLKDRPVVINGNRMSGPGVFDMKGGLAQMIFALIAVAELGLKTAVSPVILINSDEEIGSPESTDLIYHWAKRVDRAFIMEPALGLSGKLKTTRKGVGTFTISVSGKAAHAGLDPDKGVSAVLELSHLIQTLFRLNELERGISVNVGRIEGGLQPNVIAPQSKAIVDVRVPTSKDADRLEKAIRGLRPSLNGTALVIEGGFRRPPLEQTPCNLALWQIARELGREIGLDLEEATAGGASDGNFTSVYTATLDGLGAVGDGAHAKHEYIYLDKMIERTTLLTLLLLLPALSSPEDSN